MQPRYGAFIVNNYSYLLYIKAQGDCTMPLCHAPLC